MIEPDAGVDHPLARRQVSPPRIAIIADDLTGAADTAAGMLGAAQAWVTWARRAERVTWHADDRIVAVDAATRHLTAIAATEAVRSLTTLFRTAGFTHLYKKIDSTLKGHIAAEVRAALAGWHPASLAVIAPAFPAAGRTTRGGRQCVGGTPLDGPRLVERLSSAAVPVTEASLAEVRGGGLDRLFQARATAVSAGAIVCDAITDSDLAAIAAAGATLAERVVWVGSGGLARNMSLAGLPPHEHAPAVPAEGPVLVVCGSLSSVSGAQAARVAAEGAMPVPVRASVLASGGAALRSTGAEIEYLLRTGVDVLVTIQGERPALAGADLELVEQLGRMLAPCRALTSGLVATGGDTASAVLRHWEVSGLRLLAEAEPGVPIAAAMGPTPSVAALKAGAFGSEATLAVARLAVRTLLRCRPTP